jgi:hypothetical protein
MNPVTDPALDAVSDLLSRVYDVIDARSFDVAEVVGGLDSVTVFGRETAVDVLTLEARELLADAEDVTVFLLRVLDRTAVRHRVTLRMTACLIWSPIGSWLDHEREFDVTIEWTSGRDGRWRPARIRIDPPTPEAVEGRR